MATLSTRKAQIDARVNYERQAAQRSRQLLILILDHLTIEGYTQSAQMLARESGLSLADECVCDNVDLSSILLSYEEYFEHRMGHRPKLTRKGDGNSNPRGVIPSRSAVAAVAAQMRGPEGPGIALPGIRSGQSSAHSVRTPSANLSHSQTSQVQQPHPQVQQTQQQSAFPEIQSQSLQPQPQQQKESSGASQRGASETPALLPAVPPALAQMMDDEYLTAIRRDLLVQAPGIRWNDVIGLQDAKRVLREAVVLPLRYPELFTGVLRPWRGILLYGPSGTGKTLLAKAAATECGTSFFNVSAATLVSRYRGDSEKLVRCLFDYARAVAPAILFIDECDALLGKRSGGAEEHEASRRLKTELLIQLDGLSSAQNDAAVFVMCASNLPWDLDPAFLRRLEKRIYAPLPSAPARKVMMEMYLGDRCPSAEARAELEAAAAAAEGFSGADILNACKEAAMGPLRRLLDQMGDDLTLPVVAPNDSETPVASLPVARGMGENQSEAMPPLLVEAADIRRAFQRTRPTGGILTEKYQEFTREHQTL